MVFYFFIVQAVGRTILGRLVSKIVIIILNSRVDTSKNKIIDHRVKEYYVNESDHISFLHDSAMSSALNFCFLSISLQPKRKTKY